MSYECENRYVLRRVLNRDAPIIGRLLVVLPIIGIGQLVRWYRPIVIYTTDKYKLLFLLPKVNKHESGLHFR